VPSSPVPMRDRWLAAGLVAAAILYQAVWLGLPGSFLSLMLVVSYGLWIGTEWQVSPRLQLAFVLGLAVMVAHVVEEYATGFATAAPALFGREPWSVGRWLTFNAVFGLVFWAAAVSLRRGRSLPAFVALFFAVAAGVGNGVVHLLIVLQRGAYFPGAWTAPLCLAVGVWLLWLLYAPRPLAERYG